MPNWRSRQSWLGKVFELRWRFQKRLNEDIANKQASLIYNCSSANKKKKFAPLARLIQVFSVFNWGSISHGESEFFSVPRSWQDKKTSFPISLPSSKLNISLISIYKHYAIDIADPSSMPPPPALICKLFFIFTHKAKIKCPRNKYGVIVSLNSILWVRSRVRPQITLSRAENKAVSYCF